MARFMDTGNVTGWSGINTTSETPPRRPFIAAPRDVRGGYFAKNSVKIATLPQFKRELINIIKNNTPGGINVDANQSPEYIVGALDSIMTRLKTRYENFQEVVRDPTEEQNTRRFDHKFWYILFSFLDAQKHQMDRVFSLLLNDLEYINMMNMNVKKEMCKIEPKIKKTRKRIEEIENQVYGENEGPDFENAESLAKLTKLIHRNNIENSLIGKSKFEKERYDNLIGDAQKMVLSLKTNESYLQELTLRADIEKVVENAFKAAMSSGNELALQPSEETCHQILNKFEEIVSGFINERNQTLVMMQEDAIGASREKFQLENQLNVNKQQLLAIEEEERRLREIREQESQRSDLNVTQPRGFSPPSHGVDLNRVYNLDDLPGADLNRTQPRGPSPSRGIDLNRVYNLDDLPGADLNRTQPRGPSPSRSENDLNRVQYLDDWNRPHDQYDSNRVQDWSFTQDDNELLASQNYSSSASNESLLNQMENYELVPSTFNQSGQIEELLRGAQNVSGPSEDASFSRNTVARRRSPAHYYQFADYDLSSSGSRRGDISGN